MLKLSIKVLSNNSIKKNKIDKCNVCGEIKELTWEHAIHPYIHIS